MRSLLSHSNMIQKILLVFIFQSFCLIGWSQSKDNSTGQSLDFYKGRVFDVSFSDESIRLPFTLGKSEAFSEWFIIDRTAGEYKLGNPDFRGGSSGSGRNALALVNLQLIYECGGGQFLVLVREFL